MPFTEKDRKKGHEKSAELQSGWPSAPSTLEQSNMLWNIRMKGRKFTSIKSERDNNMEQDTGGKLLLKKNKIIELVGNRVFNFAFIKKDGTLREITCRLDVKSHCGDGEQTADPNKYLVVFDMNSAKDVEAHQRKKCYRNVNVDTIQYIKYAGERYFQCQ